MGDADQRLFLDNRPENKKPRHCRGLYATEL
jgi:hypothetical protein